MSLFIYGASHGLRLLHNLRRIYHRKSRVLSRTSGGGETTIVCNRTVNNESIPTMILDIGTLTTINLYLYYIICICNKNIHYARAACRCSVRVTHRVYVFIYFLVFAFFALEMLNNVTRVSF